MLSKKHLTDVCLTGQGCEMCRYLFQDEFDWSKFNCIKLRPIEKAKIDAKINDYLADCKKKGIDPQKQSTPIGDNCSGYPVLKTLVQGYDQNP